MCKLPAACPPRTIIHKFVVIHSGTFYNSVQVEIIIEDIYDNGPIFEVSQLRATVSENHAIDEPFFVVYATDADSGNNGDVTYRILQSSPPGSFMVGSLFCSNTIRIADSTVHWGTRTDGAIGL